MISTLSFLNSSCIIGNKAQALASNYEQTSTWTNALTATPCAVQALRVWEVSQDGREAGAQEFDVYFAPGTTIRNGDQLNSFSGACGLGSTDVLEVISSQADDGGENAYVRVLARQIKGSDPR